ncbi:MFS family permease [Rubricella aquisinus]|uniref:MFS family permease n=1 Tax=Rubricella aquisinus TaxID=2028108 RepID=A0A840WP63_9RHOB|nr:MFS transporter [Rubricella aquisinus]MBB5516848.1 MFS family permease [Rubricella aquisinus]
MSFPDALRHRDFRIYILGAFFALNGVWVGRIAVGWLGWSLTGSASYVGLLALASLLPTVIVGPIFGAIADRVNLKTAALAIQASLCVVTLVFFLIYLSGAVGKLLLLIYAIVSGVITAAYHPIRLALAPRLVPREVIGSAVPMISINFNMSRFIGPFIAGSLIALYGVGAAFAVTAVSVVPLLIAIAVVRPRARQAPDRAPLSMARSIIEGLRFALADPMIRLGMAITAVTSLAARGVQEILPVIADGAFARGPEGLGQLTAAAGLGAVAASVWIATHPVADGDRLPRRSVWSAWASQALVACLAVVPVWWGAVALTVGLGVTGTLTAVGIQSAIQMRLDDGMRGRVMSTWVMLAIGSMAGGALMLGALVDLLGLGPALMIGAGTGVVLLGILSRRVA